jgi:hypothetical protein
MPAESTAFLMFNLQIAPMKGSKRFDNLKKQLVEHANVASQRLADAASRSS